MIPIEIVALGFFLMISFCIFELIITLNLKQQYNERLKKDKDSEIYNNIYNTMCVKNYEICKDCRVIPFNLLNYKNN